MTEGSRPCATLLVPTSRRAEQARRCVDALSSVVATSAAAVDRILVEDNGSDPPLTLGPLAGPVVVEVHHHPKANVSLARNRGLARATTELVVLVDDDVVARGGWLDALLAPFDDPTVAAVVGPVLLRCEPHRPGWLTEPLAPWFSALDLGDDDRLLRDHEHGWAANVALRRDAALAVGGYDPGLGPGTGTYADDTDLLDRLRHAGARVAYAAEAAVDHVIGPDRLRLRWLAARTYRQGRTDVLLAGRETAFPPTTRRRAAAAALGELPRAAARAAWHTCRDPQTRPGLLAEQVAITAQALGRALGAADATR